MADQWFTVPRGHPGRLRTCGPVAADLNSQKLKVNSQLTWFRPSEQLRLNMSVAPASSPDRLGVVGADNAGFLLDITLQAAAGVVQPGHPCAVDTPGDGVDGNQLPFRPAFPYLALPNKESVNQF